MPMKPGPFAQGQRVKPTVFGKHKKWLKQRADETRRLKEDGEAAVATKEEKREVFAKKSEQLRSGILHADDAGAGRFTTFVVHF